MKPSRSTRTAEFDEPAFLRRLREGEQDAYRQLIRRMHGSLVNVAAAIIGSRAQAEEVAQETWLVVYSGIDRFEGRSSLATWLFSIAVNRARTRIKRECRTVGLPGLTDDGGPTARTVDGTDFTPAGRWIVVPQLWDELSPERIVAGQQLWAHARDAIEALPPAQRAVVVLRDQEGKEPAEICEILSISPENQRVLLHRARTSIRETVDALIGQIPSPARSTASRRNAGSISRRLVGRGSHANALSWNGA